MGASVVEGGVGLDEEGVVVCVRALPDLRPIGGHCGVHRRNKV